MKAPVVAVKTELALPCSVKAAPVLPMLVAADRLVISLLAPEAAAPRLVRAPAAVVEPVPPLATVVWPVRRVLLRSTVLVESTPDAFVWTIPAELRPLSVTVPPMFRPPVPWIRPEPPLTPTLLTKPVATTLPAAETLKRLTPPVWTSIRLPVGVRLVLLAKIKAEPAAGLVAVTTLSLPKVTAEVVLMSCGRLKVTVLVALAMFTWFAVPTMLTAPVKALTELTPLEVPVVQLPQVGATPAPVLTRHCAPVDAAVLISLVPSE